MDGGVQVAAQGDEWAENWPGCVRRMHVIPVSKGLDRSGIAGCGNDANNTKTIPRGMYKDNNIKMVFASEMSSNLFFGSLFTLQADYTRLKVLREWGGRKGAEKARGAQHHLVGANITSGFHRPPSVDKTPRNPLQA